MSKTAQLALVLSLLLPLAHGVSAAPHASFSHGFSSHAASSHASSSHTSAPHAPAATRAADSARPGGGFGSFGKAAAPSGQSDSALSRQLGRQSSEAKALQTLDQRRQTQTAQTAPQPAPAYAPSAPAQPAGIPAPGPMQAPTTVIVQRDSGGMGHVIAGAMIAHSMNAHANPGYYPAPGANQSTPNYGGSGNVNTAGGGLSFFGLFLWLCLLVLAAWAIWFAYRRMRSRRAASRDADKPNYSFERN